MIILACIDGGLICVPTMIILGILSVVCPSVVIYLKKKFSWCKKKSCHCDCHDSPKPKGKFDPFIGTKKHK